MDAQRLLTLIDQTLADLADHQIIEKLQTVVQQFKAYVDAPTDENSSATETAVDELLAALRECEVGKLHPLQRGMLAEIGGTEFLGSGLADRVADIWDEAALPAAHHKEYTELHAQVAQYKTQLDQVSTNLKAIGVKPYLLRPDEAEVGISIPDTLTKGTIKGVEGQLHAWNIWFSKFTELVTGDAQPIRVARFDNGSLIFWMLTAPPVALGFLAIVNRILDAYLKVQKIITWHRTGQQELDMPKKLLRDIEEERVKRIDAESKRIADEVYKDFALKRTDPEENARKNALQMTIRFVFYQIDHGTNIEVKLLDTQVSEEDSAKAKKSKQPGLTRPVKEELGQNATAWQELEPRTKPILNLPEPIIEEIESPPVEKTKAARNPQAASKND